jgi:hypothetical protein
MVDRRGSPGDARVPEQLLRRVVFDRNELLRGRSVVDEDIGGAVGWRSLDDRRKPEPSERASEQPVGRVVLQRNELLRGRSVVDKGVGGAVGWRSLVDRREPEPSGRAFEQSLGRVVLHRDELSRRWYRVRFDRQRDARRAVGRDTLVDRREFQAS